MSQLCGSSTDLSWAHSCSCIHLIGQLWTELTWACWTLNKLDLSMWPFIFKEVRPGFFTWLQEHSKSQAPMCKHLSTLYLHHICLYPTRQSHIHKPEPLQEDVDTRRCDWLQVINVTNYNKQLLNRAVTYSSSNPSNSWIMLFFNKIFPICSISFKS